MTPTEDFSGLCRLAGGIGPTAKALRTDSRKVRRWAKGHEPVPEIVIQRLRPIALTSIGAHVEQRPYDVEWPGLRDAVAAVMRKRARCAPEEAINAE